MFFNKFQKLIALIFFISVVEDNLILKINLELNLNVWNIFIPI